MSASWPNTRTGSRRCQSGRSLDLLGGRVYMYVCMYICVYVCMYYLCIIQSLHTCRYDIIYIYIYIYIYMHRSMYAVYMYACIHMLIIKFIPSSVSKGRHPPQFFSYLAHACMYVCIMILYEFKCMFSVRIHVCMHACMWVGTVV